MTKISSIRGWVGAVACIAGALGFAAYSVAQESQDDQNQPQQTSNQTEQGRDSGDQQQQNQRQSQQDQQREQAEQQRGQQDQQRRQGDQQSRQREQQGQRQGDSDQSRWNEGRNRQWSQEGSTWPEPNRDGFSQQGTQFQYDVERQTTRSGGRADEQDAGLGVNIIGDLGPGVVVSRVFGGTPADEMGIREGDRITQLNNQDVRSVNEFISRIRNMNPGDEVELEVLRNRDEQTVRGELETRQEALLLSNRQQTGRQRQQGDQSWQTGYQESDRYGNIQQQGRTTRSGDYSSRLNSIEQQVSRLGRELEQIRFALQELRQGERGIQQYGGTRESQAGYSEYQGGNESQRYGSRPQADQWDGRTDQGSRQSDRFQSGGQQRSFEASQRNNQSSFRDAAEGGSEGPAGITGGRRTRPDSDLDRLDR